MRPQPPAHLLLRTSDERHGERLWRHDVGDSFEALGTDRWGRTWAQLDAGEFGDVELLVPVPYRELGDGQPGALLMRQAAEALVSPAGAMMADLAAAFAAGTLATIGEAYNVGRFDQRVEAAREATS